MLCAPIREGLGGQIQDLVFGSSAGTEVGDFVGYRVEGVTGRAFRVWEGGYMHRRAKRVPRGTRFAHRLCATADTVSLNSRLESNKQEEEGLGGQSGYMQRRAKRVPKGTAPEDFCPQMSRFSRKKIPNANPAGRWGGVRPLSSECGTYKTVKTGFWPWLNLAWGFR